MAAFSLSGRSARICTNVKKNIVQTWRIIGGSVTAFAIVAVYPDSPWLLSRALTFFYLDKSPSLGSGAENYDLFVLAAGVGGSHSRLIR